MLGLTCVTSSNWKLRFHIMVLWLFYTGSVMFKEQKVLAGHVRQVAVVINDKKMHREGQKVIAERTSSYTGGGFIRLVIVEFLTLRSQVQIH